MNKSDNVTSQKATSSPHTDDESITTSTESDSLETWTLVNDKNKKNNADTSFVQENCPSTSNRIEILTNIKESVTNGNKAIHESADSRTDEDSNNDEISEGISIISESESAGRASPIEIAENLNSLDLKGFPNPDDVSPASMLRLPIHIQSSYSLPSSVHTFDDTTLRQRRIRRSSSSTNSERKVVKPQAASVVNANPLYPLVSKGLKGVFFVCVALAILAFIGKLRNPDWQPFSDIKNLSEMEQRLTDLELQNNLMRAEIDILSKQVNFLSSLSGSGRFHNIEREHKPQQRHFKQTGEWIMKQKGKTSKELNINEDNTDHSQISKDGVKQSNKCPNGQFTENAAICEKSEPEIKTVDDILNPDNMQPLKYTPIDESATNPYVNEPINSANTAGPKRDETEFKNINKYPNNDRKNSKEYESHNYEKKKWKHQKHLHRANENDDDDLSEEDDDNDDSREDFGGKKSSSKESYNKHDRYKERRFNGNSNEKFFDRSDEQPRKSGEWHGKLMQQRENARRQNEYRQRNKNWYIERGDSREKMRHGR